MVGLNVITVTKSSLHGDVFKFMWNEIAVRQTKDRATAQAMEVGPRPCKAEVDDFHVIHQPFLA